MEVQHFSMFDGLLDESNTFRFRKVEVDPDELSQNNMTPGYILGKGHAVSLDDIVYS